MLLIHHRHQDSYRVLIFDDLLLGNVVPIPPHAVLPERGSVSAQTEHLLRQHFARCMHVHFCGGDIRSQYSDAEVWNLMDNLGIGRDCADIDVAPLDDERWHNTELGRVLLQSYLEGEIQDRRWRDFGDGDSSNEEDQESPTSKLGSS